MDPDAERGVAVDLAVDDDLICLVELSRIAVRRRVRQQDPVLRLHVRAAEVDVPSDQASHGDRRVGAEELFCGERQQARLGPQPFQVSGILRQVPQGGADRAGGRVDAGDQQQRHRADHVRSAELAAVHLGVDQERGQVVARVIEVVVNLF